jgi:hypothetical protein
MMICPPVYWIERAAIRLSLADGIRDEAVVG